MDQTDTDNRQSNVPQTPETVETFPEQRHWPSANLCSMCSGLELEDANFGMEGYQGYAAGDRLAFFEERGIGSTTSPKFKPFLWATMGVHMDVLPGLEKLRVSAEAGCDFCRQLRELAPGFIHTGSAVGPVIFAISYLWRPSRALEIGLHAAVVAIAIAIDEKERSLFEERQIMVGENGQLFQTANSLVFRVESGEGNCQDWLQIENAPRKGEFLCKANVSDLKELLDEYSCKAWDIQGNRANPARLLDLEASNTTDGICLTEVSSQDRLKYAALSYCWGSVEDAKTQTILTTENMADRLADITFHSLSPVMQDAVVATRKLGIRYLWIDALCIIQNCPADWETQSRKMGDIYSNCFTSIEALASSSCREGFLSRPEPVTINFQSTIRPSIRGTFGLRFHSTQSLRRDPFAKSGYGAEFETSWTDRGWTLQENVLPHTQISFGASRLCFTHEHEAFLEPFEGDREKVLAHTTFNTPATSHHARWRVYSYWQKLLIDYGGRSTSRLSDRLPALSGLAQRIASITGDEYIAGHWKECMTMSLPWLVVYSDSSNLAERLSQLSCPQPYIAPSWSWANMKPVLGKQYIRNQITTRLPRPGWCYFHSECHVSSVWSEPVSQLNPFGAITYAELQLTGRLVEVPRGLHRDKRPHWFPLDQVWLAGLGEDDIAICMLDWSEEPQTDFLKGNFLLLLTSSWSNVDVPEDSLFRWPLHDVGNTFRINPPYTYERTLLPDRPASSKDEGVHGGEKSRKNLSDERNNDDNMSKTHPRSGHTEEHSLEGKPTKNSARQPFNDTPSVYNPSSNNDPDLPDAMSALRLDNQEEHDNQKHPPVTRPRGPNRIAMGIVLHAAPDRLGKYYRMGCFESHPAQGGTDAFERFQEREVHLI